MDRSKIIKEILKVKDIKDLESKNDDELNYIRYRKYIVNNLEFRKKFEEKLYETDNEFFNKKKLDSLDFLKIKELYRDYVLHRKDRTEYLNYITNKTSMTIERISKWSTKRLQDKVKTLKLVENKSQIMLELKSYGDGITKVNTPTNIQSQRINFLREHGSKNKSEERFEVTKKLSYLLKKMNKRHLYKNLMITDVNQLYKEYKELYKEYYRSSLIEYLKEYEYTTNFLKKQKTYVLEYMKSDIKPCEKGSRKELIKMLAAKNIWSRNTIRNWDMDKLRSAYIKHIQNKYSPLSEYVPNRPLTKAEKEKIKNKPAHPRLNNSRQEVLKDLTDTLFVDIISGN